MGGMNKVPFHEDELAFSFVSRMARANGRLSARGFLKDFGLDASLIDEGDEKEITTLAGILETPVELLSSRSVRFMDDETCQFAGSTFARRALFRRKLRACPHCLAEDEADVTRMENTRRYVRTSWIFSSVETCVRHDVALEFANYHIDTRVPNTSDMLDDVAAKYIDAGSWRRQPSNAFERFVVDRLDNKVCHGEMLDTLSLSVAIDCSQLLGRAAVFGKKFNARKHTDEDNRWATLVGFKALREGAAGTRKVLDGLASGIMPGSSTSARSLYGNLYEALRLSSRGEEYHAVRQLLRDHMKSTAPGNSAWSFAHNPDRPADKVNWVSPHAIATELGINHASLRRQLAHQGVEIRSSGGRTSVISREDSERVIQSYRSTLEGGEVITLLGLSGRDLIHLADTGMLVPSPDFESSRQGTPARYRKEEVNALLEGLPKSKETAGLKQLFRAKFGVAQVRAEIYQAIFGGELKRMAYIPSIAFSRSAWVDLDELVDLLARKRQTLAA